ncbi:MAG: hypothetical protein HOP17_09755, partial [Acidobacteria bacterium]|nr:hypothetical protein [Acidobacteriota bacterium]
MNAYRLNLATRFRSGAWLALFVLLFAVSAAFSQSSSNDEPLIPGQRQRNDDQPKTVKEYLAKQRAEKAKKDHEELLKRGDEVIELTDQLEHAFEKSNGLSTADRSKLESLEKLVTKIRKGLGGGDDDESEQPDANGVIATREKEPGTLEEAFTALKEKTSNLVDELKKTTRFTVS